MTAIQFITEITKSGNQIKISGETIPDKVYIRKSLIANGIIVENCVFENGFFLEDIDLNYGIKFIGCVFIKNISFISCRATKYDQEINFDGYHLEFKNTKIDGLSFNNNNHIERGVRVCEKSIIRNIHVENLISKIGGFEINGSTVEILFDIIQSKIMNVSVINNSIIDAKVRFDNIECRFILFTDSIFKKDIHIWAGKVDSLTFEDGVFDDDLSILAVPISSCLTINGTEFKKSIKFTLRDDTNNITGSISKVYIKSGKFGEQFIINGNSNQIDELIIDTSKQLDGDLCFNSCNILLATLSGNNSKSNIVFNFSYFNKLNFDFFNNYSTLSLLSLKSFNENSELAITHSNLGKTHLFNAFLNTFDKVTIYNSVLTEVITANVKWFKDENLNSTISASSEEYTYKKEIYRQIKFALEKQGDRISSLRFKALEMTAFKKESFANVKWYKKIISIDRFILWLGQTNSFGQNWLKPTFLAVGFTLFFYFLIIVGVSNKLSYVPNINEISIGVTWGELIHYSNIIPQLMNPTNNLSKVFPESVNFNFSVNLWDYLLKISLAFFIFQIISAFRKYMK